jgi:hypothetical protein
MEGRKCSSSGDAGTGAAWRAFSRLSKGCAFASGGIGLPGADLSLLDCPHPPGILDEEELWDKALMYILSASSWLNSWD